jgi:hypothetical protein
VRTITRLRFRMYPSVGEYFEFASCLVGCVVEGAVTVNLCADGFLV